MLLAQLTLKAGLRNYVTVRHSHCGRPLRAEQLRSAWQSERAACPTGCGSPAAFIGCRSLPLAAWPHGAAKSAPRQGGCAPTQFHP